MGSNMADTAIAVRTCQKCGATILPHESGGSCGACLLETALGPLIEDGKGARPVLIDFGGYELLEELGRGGQGVVYRARQKSLNRIVALKVIGLGHWAATAHVKRFRKEAEAAARLEHPGIVPIYEVGERDGSCFFSMKFVEGGQLDAFIKREPMSPRQAVELLAKIARTVQFAHERGILHRDIKPGNILLDAKGEPQLTDFGLARLVEQESTVTNSFDVLGTPSYMSPEQAGGYAKELTAAADVYGLGAVFYQLLTGHPPFAGGTTYETIRLVLETDPRRPRLWNPKVDRDLEVIVFKCLEKDPQKRYPTAEALAEDLERWLSHKPIRARPASLFLRTRKWIQRNPVTTVLGPSLAALAIALGILFWKTEPVPLPTGIAVLPFENLADKENSFLADGIQDDILTKLAKVADLKVISRTSVMQYRGERNVRKIGQTLRVSHILEGSVQNVDGLIRVNAQLIDARTDAHVWAETYQRERSELFTLESDVAKQVAARLRSRISALEKSAIEERPTNDLEAYKLYLQARAVTQQISIAMDGDPLRDGQKVVDLLQRAVARDPRFALGWSALAEAYLYLYWWPGREMKWRERAEAALLKATQLAPEAGETHLARALFLYWGSLDYDGALQELEIARRVLPNNADVFRLTGWVERRLGRWKECLRHSARAVDLDPHNLGDRENLMLNHIFIRRFDDAVRLADEGLAEFRDHENFKMLKAEALLGKGDLRATHDLLATFSPNAQMTPRRFLVLFNLLLYERNYSEAERYIAKRKELLHHEDLLPDVCFNAFVAHAQGDAAKIQTAFSQCHDELVPQLHDRPKEGLWISALGLADAALGRRDDAVREVAEGYQSTDELNRSYIVLDSANVRVWLGDRDGALSTLEKVVNTAIGVSSGDLKFNPCWDPLRDDPRFQKILADAAQPLPIQ